MHSTGRRITAVCVLQYQELRPNEGPYGSLRWSADSDKMGRETVAPVGPAVRAAVQRILRDRPGVGAAPIFPSPKDRQSPIRYELASEWLREAEKLGIL